MKPRIDYLRDMPALVEAMRGLEQQITRSGLDPALVRLVKLRASQMNGCAYCLDLHGREALKAGIEPRKLHALGAHRDAPFYSERERAALAWTEAVTRLAEGGISDAVYAQARQHFDEPALANLTLAIVAINGWNRLSVAFRYPPAEL